MGVGAASAALDEVARIESQLSVYREESELSLLNRRAWSGAVGVEPGLYRLLERCRDLAELTGGAFDITAGPLSRIWGFTHREGRVPTVEEIEAARARVGSGMMSCV
jgi:thiamine biosynthesis lipoprotein